MYTSLHDKYQNNLIDGAIIFRYVLPRSFLSVEGLSPLWHLLNKFLIGTSIMWLINHNQVCYQHSPQMWIWLLIRTFLWFLLICIYQTSGIPGLVTCTGCLSEVGIELTEFPGKPPECRISPGFLLLTNLQIKIMNIFSV